MRDYLRQGRLSIQGAGSQLVLEALDAPRWEGPVWDACAGRGGKTLALVELGVQSSPPAIRTSPGCGA